MKNILIICGHPDKNSLNYALAQAYQKEAEATHNVRFIHLRSLNFNYNLEHGYNKRTELEPDLLQAQQDILWANHLVWFYPTWWGSYPAVMKAFIDRTFLPGFAFKYKENSPWWNKYLSGKTGHIFTTMHTPYWYYKLIYRAPSIHSLRKITLQFCGIQKVKTTVFAQTHDKEHLPKDPWFETVRKAAKAIK